MWVELAGSGGAFEGVPKVSWHHRVNHNEDGSLVPYAWGTFFGFCKLMPLASHNSCLTGCFHIDLLSRYFGKVLMVLWSAIEPGKCPGYLVVRQCINYNETYTLSLLC